MVIVIHPQHRIILSLLSFRLIPHWNHFPFSGSLLDWKMLKAAGWGGGLFEPAVLLCRR